MQGPAAPHAAGSDQVGADQDVELPPRQGAGSAQKGDRLVARLRSRREGQEAEQARGFRVQAAVRQVEGGPHAPFAVVQVIEERGGAGQLRHEFRHRLSRIGDQQSGRDLQRQGQPPAQLAQPHGRPGVVQDASVGGGRRAQRAVQDVPGHLRAEDVQMEHVGTELGHGVARRDEHPVRGVTGQQWSDLPGVRGVVHHDQHAAAGAGPLGQDRAVEPGALVQRARHVRGRHAQGAQQGLQELFGSGG
ncbi:hypothetical protein GCM10017687_12380 [Streptomyces echinatus]